MVPTSMPLKPSRVLVPTMPGPIATTAASACATCARDRERRVDRHRLEVAAERVAARDGGVEEVALAQRGDEIRQRHRQAGAVGHDVREPSPGRAVLERGRDRRHLAVERRRDHGHAVDRLHLGERLEVLLGAPDVGLEARVAALDDVAGPALVPFVAAQVPVHDVPAAGAEPELDRGGVHHDGIAERDRSGELRQHVRVLRAVTEIDLDALQPGALLEQPHDLASSKRRHCDRASYS